MRTPWVIVVVLFATVFASSCTTGSQSERLETRTATPGFRDPDRRAKLARAFPEIDRLMGEFQARARVPGIAYGVVVDGELAHFGSSGYREIESKAAVDADTVFRIASMTKSFTAMSILKLRDEGKLNLDDPAEKYVPELASLRYPTSDSPKITIRHLLSHAEGFPEDNPWGDRQLAVSDDRMNQMMREGIPFSNAPGVAYEYSNYGFAILGRIVSNVSGESYADYVRSKILQPLGMTATTLEPSAVPASRRARGYKRDGEHWIEEPPLADGAFGAMGGMLTSSRDLSRYVAFLMSAWPPRDDPDTGPVRRSSLREMQQQWRDSGATVSRDASEATILNSGAYGFGLRVWQTCDFRHIVAHGGGLPGYGSHMRWLPEYGVGFIAMGNLTYTGWNGVTDAAFQAMRQTGGLEPRQIAPSRDLLAAKDAVTKLIAGWDERTGDTIAAENLYMDRSKEVRQQELADLRSRVGACRPEGPFDVENALRGQWTMACDRGSVRASITLAPTMPPRVQYMEVREVDPSRPIRQAACAAP